MSSKMKMALDAIEKEISDMSDEEFQALVNKHSNGDIATLLKNAGAFAQIENQLLSELTGQQIRDLAYEFQVAPSCVRRWLNGTARPHPRLKSKIDEAIGKVGKRK